MPASRFAILHHRVGGGEHWDLLIAKPEAHFDRADERELTTWQLAADPFAGDGTAIAATRIADHRNVYLDYEGPVPGNRGEVTHLDGGACEILESGESVWRFRLAGARLRGVYALTLAEAGFWTLAQSIGQ